MSIMACYFLDQNHSVSFRAKSKVLTRTFNAKQELFPISTLTSILSNPSFHQSLCPSCYLNMQGHSHHRDWVLTLPFPQIWCSSHWSPHQLHQNATINTSNPTSYQHACPWAPTFTRPTLAHLQLQPSLRTRNHWVKAFIPLNTPQSHFHIYFQIKGFMEFPAQMTVVFTCMNDTWRIPLT